MANGRSGRMNRQEPALSEPRRKERFFDSSDSLRMTASAASRTGRQERQGVGGGVLPQRHQDTKVRTDRSRSRVCGCRLGFSLCLRVLVVNSYCGS